jgi:hypothetical protein
VPTRVPKNVTCTFVTNMFVYLPKILFRIKISFTKKLVYLPGGNIWTV